MLRRMLVLAVVVGVVLSQEAIRRVRPRPSQSQGALAPRPFNSASLSPGGGNRIRVVRPPALLPNPLATPPTRQVFRPAPPPQAPPPPPPPAPTPLPIAPVSFRFLTPGQFSEANTASRSAPSSRNPTPSPSQPSSQARRPQSSFSNVDADFNLQTTTPRGRKEPEVKILRSWSHHNADGTFSWGYINDDGSFKNETRGHDCVVRGVYGYVDVETGEQLSFPYETGIACDPDAPDYYYDYDSNVLVLDDAGEAVRASPNTGGSGPFSRRG